MTQEDKELLLKDLCARIPYGVKFVIDNGLYNVRTLSGIDETVPFAGWEMCVFARGMLRNSVTIFIAVLLKMKLIMMILKSFILKVNYGIKC